MNIAQNIAAITAEIKISPSPEAILLAVSKGQSAEKIQAAIQSGHRYFAENRIEEIKEKWPAIKAAHPQVQLHYIGHIQRKKLKEIVHYCDAIHTVDRAEIIETLLTIAPAEALPALFIQLNLANEPQKSGIPPEKLPDLLDFCQKQHASITGLMCLPPQNHPPEPYFTQLATLAQQHGLKHTSMGMSGDYPQALAAGASYIRVGTGVFGAR